MERTALLAFSTIGMVAVFLILLGERLGWPELRDVLVHQATAAWVQAIGSIGAIGAAAWVVHRQHKLEVERLEEQRIQGQVDAINGAMLTLYSQLNMLVVFRAQILEAERGNPARHFALSATEAFEFAHWIIDWKALSFLVPSSAQAALLDAILAHNAFHSATQSANERSRLHRIELQPRLEASGLDFDAGVTGEAVERAVGQRLTHTMRVMTDDLYEQVDLAIRHLTKAGDSAAKALRDVYRGHRILGFAPPKPGP
jgi:hypothetical protein